VRARGRLLHNNAFGPKLAALENDPMCAEIGKAE
jgi:hypothetical protein